MGGLIDGRALLLSFLPSALMSQAEKVDKSFLGEQDP